MTAVQHHSDALVGWLIIIWLGGGVVLVGDGVERNRWWEVLIGVLMWAFILLGIASARGLV